MDNILYLEAQQRQVVVYLHNEPRTQYRFYSTMAALEDALAAQGFLRIHKSYLVNMQHIHALHGGGVSLQNGKLLPVSERRYAEIKSRYLLWRGQSKCRIY